jgi:hypothetical protein
MASELLSPLPSLTPRWFTTIFERDGEQNTRRHLERLRDIPQQGNRRLSFTCFD